MDAPEALQHLLDLQFQPAASPPASEILNVWPQNETHEIALFRVLDRALFEALEAAADVGALDGWDRTNWDVPSVAPHKQNAYHRGFYPITRVLADLWCRISGRNPNQARAFIEPWLSSRFPLALRLALFALEATVFSADEAAAVIHKLDDDAFWSGGAQVEIMRLLAARWAEFRDADRLNIESRIRHGVPRSLYRLDAFENEDEWNTIWDSSVYRRLKRIEQVGGSLTEEAKALLGDISAKNPTWQASRADRDDFSVWHEVGSGPDGKPELLAQVPDDRLVQEAMRIQHERYFEQGGLWRVFCGADPDRALRGLILEANNGRWEADPWRAIIWTASEKGDGFFQVKVADQILQMPHEVLGKILPSVSSWLQKRREILGAPELPGDARFLGLWDSLADIAYCDSETENAQPANDVLSDAFNETGGILAWTMVDALSVRKLEKGAGLSEDLRPRFDRLATAPGRPGLLARVYLAQSLAYFDAIDPDWTAQHLLPHFSWDDPEAPSLWRPYSHGNVGSARLFNALKPHLLAAFENGRVSENEIEELTSQLLSVAIWRQRGEASDYDLTTAEVRRVLTVGPAEARHNVAWNFWRFMGDANADPPDKASRWRNILGPLFRDIWPLDANLRSERTARDLVLMALECGDAFPDAVEAILDLIVPYQLYQLSHSLRLEQQHRELVHRHPLAFVRLVNAFVDPKLFRIPNDLAAFLDDCVAANPLVVGDSAYIRLFGLRRLAFA